MTSKIRQTIPATPAIIQGSSTFCLSFKKTVGFPCSSDSKYEDLSFDPGIVGTLAALSTDTAVPSSACKSSSSTCKLSSRSSAGCGKSGTISLVPDFRDAESDKPFLAASVTWSSGRGGISDRLILVTSGLCDKFFACFVPSITTCHPQDASADKF